MALRRKVETPVDPEETVPPALKIAAAYSWRILIVLGVVAVLVFLVIQFRYIVVPFMVAILLGALLVPFVNFLRRHRWPKWLAIAVAMLGTLGIVSGLVVLVVLQVRAGYPDLQEKSILAYENLKTWLGNGRDVAVVIGGADGLDPAVKQKADRLLQLSAMTLPHGMVRVLLAEQMYRAWSLLNNHPYHRE